MSVRIALDGPGGAGKSSVARTLALRLGIPYLDTGAMYRCCALQAEREGTDIRDAEAVERLMRGIRLDLRLTETGAEFLLQGEPVGDAIRRPAISQGASAISALPACRRVLTEIQRDIASKRDLILDGRDIGTVVLPNAELKIFLTASPEERARRRYLELQAKGCEQSYEEVLHDLEVRDRRDSERAVAPLRQAPDATRIETDYMDFETVVTRILELCRLRFPGRFPKMEAELRAASPAKRGPLPLRRLIGSQRHHRHPVLPPRDGKGVWEEPRLDPTQRQPGRRLWTRLIIGLAYGLIWLIFRLRVEGRANGRQEGPFIAAGNHQSFCDIPILLHLIRPWPHMLGRRTLFRSSLVRRIFYGMGAFPVDLDRPSVTAAKRTLSVLKRGGVIGLYPEGTRLIAEQIAGDVRAKTGAVRFAAKAKASFVLISISRPFRIFRRNYVRISPKITLEELSRDLAPEDVNDAALTRRLMEKIYAQIGEVYFPESEPSL